MLRAWAFVLAALTCLVVVYIVCADWPDTSCKSSKKRVLCYFETTDTIVREKGIAPALEYLEETVLPESGFSITHMVGHSIGDQAYREKGDFEAALEYLRPYARYASYDDFAGFDGFVHGVLSSYFLDSSDRVPLSELAQEVCREDSVLFAVIGGAPQCFHALGHALVHSNENHAEPALDVCDAALGNKADRCYFGAFMELSHLFHPYYHQGYPRPDSEGDSMRALCERFSGKRAFWCSHFVGETYFILHWRDFPGAFDACMELPSEYQETCTARLGNVIVTAFAATDADVLRVCEHAGEHEDVCIAEARRGQSSAYSPGMIR